MNPSQKKGVGMMLAVVLFAVPAILEAFGVSMPGWLPVISQVITTVAGVVGISVNLPANTNVR